MEDAAELTPEEVKELRADLKVLREELQALLDDSGESSRPVDLEQPIGRVSRIDAIQQQKMAQAGRRNQEARLRLVNAALARIPGGDYGLCSECEEPIGFQRLKARPESRLCIACQSSRDKR